MGMLDGLDEDRLLIKNHHQITDDEPMALHQTASSHRGADYLQQYEVPTGLRQAGTEGGSIVPTDKIEIFGAVKQGLKSVFANYWRGLDVVGAAIAHPAPKPRAGFSAVPSGRANVRPATMHVLNNPKKHDDATSIKNAKDAGNRAVSVGQKLLKTLSTTKVKGEAFGAGPKAAVKAALSTVALQQAANRAIKAGKDVLDHADKHAKLVKANQARIKAGIAKGKAQTHFHGEDAVFGDHDLDVFGPEDLEVMGHLSARGLSDVQVFGAYVKILGDVASAVPDPNNPGYLTDGSPDPSYNPNAIPGGVSDPTAGLGAAPTMDSVKSGLVPGQDFVPDPGAATDISVYTSDLLPPGAVVYDGSQKMPYEGVGSYSRMYHQINRNANGDGNADMTGDGPFKASGFELHDDGWYYWYNANSPIGDQRWVRASDSTPMQTASTSDKNGWGPLVGNPAAWTNGLRFCEDNGAWFWYWDQAPAWAQQPILQKLLNQAVLDYKAQVAAAAANAAAQAAQQQLDAAQADALAKQQAAEDQQQQHQLDMEQAQAASQAQIQAQQDAAAQQAYEQQAATQASLYEAQSQADAAAQMQLMQQQAQLEAEAEARAAAQEQAAVEAAAQQYPDVPTGSPDDAAAAMDASDSAGPAMMDDQTAASYVDAMAGDLGGRKPRRGR